MNMARVIDRGTLNVNTAHQLFYKGILTLQCTYIYYLNPNIMIRVHAYITHEKHSFFRNLRGEC